MGTTTYTFGEGEHVESSMRAILELAGPERVGEVVYRPGVGPAGAVEVPEDLHAEFGKIKADLEAEKQNKTAAVVADGREDAARDLDDEQTPGMNADPQVLREQREADERAAENTTDDEDTDDEGDSDEEEDKGSVQTTARKSTTTRTSRRGAAKNQE